MNDKRMSADYQRAVSDFVRNNVVCCVSILVSDVRTLVASADCGVLRRTSFDEDEINNLLESKDWETPAREHIAGMDREDLKDALGLDSEDAVNDLDTDLREKLIAAVESDPGFADWEGFCNEHNIDPEYSEVYEHWVVDPWFGARLKERGEVVEDFGNLTVWGRTTTGQMISMDYVVCRIYDELHES